MVRNVSALIERHVATISEICKDQRTFSIAYIISSTKFDNAMFDLGASINVMSLSIFTYFSLEPLQTIGVESSWSIGALSTLQD